LTGEGGRAGPGLGRSVHRLQNLRLVGVEHVGHRGADELEPAQGDQRDKAGDQRVLSSEWLNESTTGYPNADGHLRYGYQWWLSSDGSVILGQGYGGQFLYIVPKQALVIAKLSYWPSGWEAELEAETFAGFSAIQASFE